MDTRIDKVYQQSLNINPISQFLSADSIVKLRHVVFVSIPLLVILWLKPKFGKPLSLPQLKLNTAFTKLALLTHPSRSSSATFPAAWWRGMRWWAPCWAPSKTNKCLWYQPTKTFSFIVVHLLGFPQFRHKGLSTATHWQRGTHDVIRLNQLY